MKRLNKNGFAISTMLYGLLIVMVLLMSLLMSTISFARSNSKKFVSNVINNLEFRDLTPPIITLSTNNSQKVLYTKTAQDLSLSFSVSDDNALDLKKSYETSFYIGTYSDKASCSSNTFSNDMKTAQITCTISIPEANETVGKLYIDAPRVSDIYGNFSSISKKETGYEVKTDDIAPTFELLSFKSGQYYLSNWNTDLIAVKLCDNNLTGTLTYMDEQKQNEVVIKIGAHKYNSTLRYLKNETSCRVYAIRPIHDVSSEGQLEIIIPGEEDGDTYGWKDKHGNISKHTILSTNITFVREDKIALHLERFEKTTLNIGKEYTLEGNINIVSSRCSGQQLHNINSHISSVCMIGDKRIQCEITPDIDQRKLKYKIKVDSNNKETGRVSITIPDRIIEDCMGSRNDKVTINLGSEFKTS